MLKELLSRTQTKLFFARVLYKIVHFFAGEDKRVIVRNGIKFEIDLSEGIDLSLFLFGGFQKNVYQNKYVYLRDGAVIFDIGANFGLMSLQFAKAVPSGRIYAFEPTFFALSGLKRNLELNPELAKNVVVIQKFVSSVSSAEPDISAYASWKVDGKDEKCVTHPVHGGTKKDAKGVEVVSLDDFCEENKIKRIDLIKIDTDGYEFEILKGGEKTIGAFKPAIIFELGIYVMEEKGVNFSDFWNLFQNANYGLLNSKNFKPINKENYLKHIPAKGTIDVLAIPNP